MDIDPVSETLPTSYGPELDRDQPIDPNKDLYDVMTHAQGPGNIALRNALSWWIFPCRMRRQDSCTSEKSDESRFPASFDTIQFAYDSVAGGHPGHTKY